MEESSLGAGCEGQNAHTKPCLSFSASNLWIPRKFSATDPVPCMPTCPPPGFCHNDHGILWNCKQAPIKGF